jgi:hypothetical protein
MDQSSRGLCHLLLYACDEKIKGYSQTLQYLFTGLSLFEML